MQREKVEDRVYSLFPCLLSHTAQRWWCVTGGNTHTHIDRYKASLTKYSTKIQPEGMISVCVCMCVCVCEEERARGLVKERECEQER